MSEQSVEMDAQADFVVPKIPLKKAPSSQQNAKATINKISSLIAPTDDYAPPVSSLLTLLSTLALYLF